MRTVAALRFWVRLLVSGGIFLTMAGGGLRAQSDDFSDGNDTGWTHYAPLAAFGVPATYTVSGGTYRITSPPSPDDQLGPARAGAVQTDVKYKTFFVSVDIRDWDPATDTSMGILARVQPNVGLATTSGYAFTYQGKDTDVQISRVEGEVPTDISGHPSIDLVPGGNYRLVFFGVGSHLEGRIYDMDSPLTPLITATATDSTFTEGSCGLVVFADENTTASAAFDNYLATAGDTAPPVLAIRGETAPLEASWDAATGLCHTLEVSFDLQTWVVGITPQIVAGGRARYLQETDPAESQQAFYRLRLGPQPAIGIE